MLFPRRRTVPDHPAPDQPVTPAARGAALIAAVDTADSAELTAVEVRAVDALDAPEAVLRRAALDAIGRLVALRQARPGREVALRIAGMKGDPAPEVRAEVAVALALLDRGEEGRSEMERLALHILLEDDAVIVRREAAAALGDVADHSARDKLATRLDAEPDAEARFECAFALASMQDRRGRPILLAALAGARRRLDACEALRRLGDPGAIPTLARLADRFLLAWPDRLSVLATMHVLGDPGAAARIVERTRARNREERAFALSLLGTHRIAAGRSALTAVASDPKDALRDTAVRALGDLGDPSAAAVLQRVATEVNAPDETRTDAAQALEKLGRVHP